MKAASEKNSLQLSASTATVKSQLSSLFQVNAYVIEASVHVPG